MKKRDGAVLWVCGGWITEKEDGSCGHWSVGVVGLLLPPKAVQQRLVRVGRLWWPIEGYHG